MKFKISDNVQSKYDAQYSDAIVPWRDIGGIYKAEHVVNLCRRNGITPRRVLEVGAGEGSILRHLNDAEFCSELYALEISDTGITYINNRNLSSLVDARKFNGYEIPYDDNNFDLVILSHVLEHVEFERALLREIRRVSAYQIIEVPLDFSDNVDERSHVYLGYGHINIYNPALLRFLLRSEGFKIIDEILDIQGEKVVEYKHFVMDKNQDGEAERQALKERLLRAREVFEARKGRERERYAKDFAVLTAGDGMSVDIF